MKRQALLLVLALATGCDRNPRPVPTIIFAVDGLEWSAVEPLLAAGRLPAMAQVAASGMVGRLETLQPTVSPVIWTTMATGRRPHDHGIRGFVTLERAGSVRLVEQGDRRVPAFWDVLSADGRTVHVLGWWATWPVEPIRGVMVSQTGRDSDEAPGEGLRKGGYRSGQADQAHPPEWQTQADRAAQAASDALPETMAAVFGPAMADGERLHRHMREQSQQSLLDDDAYARMAEQLVAAPFDVLAVYMGATDTLAHRFWRYHEPAAFAVPSTRATVWGGVVANAYAFADARIGAILAAAPTPRNVLIVSDHGMHAVHTDRDPATAARPVDLVSGHHPDAPPALLIAAGPDILPATRDTMAPPPIVGNVRGLFATILTLARAAPCQEVDAPAWLGVLRGEPDNARPRACTALRAGHRGPAPKRDRGAQNRGMDRLRSLGYLQ